MTCCCTGCHCQQAKPMEPPADISWLEMEPAYSSWLTRTPSLVRRFRAKVRLRK